MNFKPMLSATLLDPATLQYPVLVSPKLDGLRCVIQQYAALSRNLKPFRNRAVQMALHGLPNGLDGELIVGSATEGHVLNRTQSGIMSADGQPQFTYHVFDWDGQPGGFQSRLRALDTVSHPKVRLVPHYQASSLESLLKYERQFLTDGYEGLMVRGMHGEYKYGRATHNDNLLWKFKRFTDGEAVVVELLEGVVNNNPATVDALGATTRSSHTENMVPSGKVGTIIARCVLTDQLLQISPGRMTHDMREHYWRHPMQLISKIITYKTFDYGKLNAPRFSTFQAFRDASDIS